MNIDNIIKLIDAGFTRDEIIALDKAPEAPDAPAAPEAPEAQEEPAKAEPVSDTQKQFESALNNILDSFKAVAKEIKAANIANSEQPIAAAKTAEDVLIDMLAPESKKKGSK